MTNNTVKTYDHLLELQPGASGTIDFRYPKDGRKGLQVRLVSADPATHTVELALDDLWHGYEMMRLVEGDNAIPWAPIWPGADGDVHVVLALDAGERLSIESDDHRNHGISLIQGDWQKNAVQLTFRETA